MLNPANLASQLSGAERSRVAIAPFGADVTAGGLELAYEVQNENTKAALAQGRRLVGRKIGLTSLAVQKQLGVDQPDFGMLFADMEIDDGGVVPPNTLIAPKVEAEMAFVLGRDLPHADTGAAEALAAIDWVFPALEIVDSRIADWKISIFDTIADNASSGRYVLGGAPRKPQDVDFRLAGAVLERNGDPLSFGAGAACLGSRVNALRWLAQVMVKSGRPLQAGDVVLSGALGAMLPASPGDMFEARIGGLGRVAVQFGRG